MLNFPPPKLHTRSAGGHVHERVRTRRPSDHPEGGGAAVPRHRQGVDPRVVAGYTPVRGTAAMYGRALGGVGHACPVSNREIRPSSSTVKDHRVRISPQVSLE
ncbi:hypothetical protein GCM10010259_30850 [Streptomyces daghestanicus]|uniref:Uncharacterized protein n=1 Tax=Streptomyces daghestanicus TaxID=66885 RepID=A0ABQ3QB94_9ACTN|nr:hypothetical protein GCM10010259_30850 [Streptomyces daghestanicus]GHI34561.1 hypothetical protein Sdagh_62910 [Streptomyces daghestanicus]